MLFAFNHFRFGIARLLLAMANRRRRCDERENMANWCKVVHDCSYSDLKDFLNEYKKYFYKILFSLLLTYALQHFDIAKSFQIFDLNAFLLILIS